MTNAKTVRAVLAYSSFLLLAMSFVMVLRGSIEPTARDVVMVLIGAIISNAKEVYGFFFGTSQSSSDKTDALADLASGRRATEEGPGDV